MLRNIYLPNHRIHRSKDICRNLIYRHFFTKFLLIKQTKTFFYHQIKDFSIRQLVLLLRGFILNAPYILDYWSILRGILFNRVSIFTFENGLARYGPWKLGRRQRKQIKLCLSCSWYSKNKKYTLYRLDMDKI